MPTLRSLPTIRVKTQIPRGPRVYQFSAGGEIQGGYGEPPPGFMLATTSLTEWIVYWAIWKALNLPGDPRDSGPPYKGQPPEFSYQDPFMGGRSLPGGAVVDFIVWRVPTGRPVLIRLVTEYWHIFTTNAKQQADAWQSQRLMAQSDVIDLYDTDILGDETGQKAVIWVKNALRLIQRPDVIRSGTARRGPR